MAIKNHYLLWNIIEVISYDKIRFDTYDNEMRKTFINTFVSNFHKI